MAKQEPNPEQNQDQPEKKLTQRKVTRRTALKAGGVAAVGLAFSKPIIETVYPQPAFAQLSVVGSTEPTSTPGPQVQGQAQGCDPNAWVFALQWGSQGSANTQFDWPTGLEADSAGNVFVSERNNYRVQKFDPNGNFLLKWGQPGGDDDDFDEEGAGDTSIDSFDKLYIVDNNAHAIKKFDANGNFVANFFTHSPRRVAAAPGSNYYLINTFIRKHDANGNFVASWVSPLGSLSYRGAAVDGAGNVYATDGTNDQIHKFDSNGNVITTWGGLGNGDGQFHYPNGLRVVGDYLYVCDTGNNRIQVFTLGGNHVASFSGGGAGFINPYDLAVSSSCALYVLHNDVQVMKFVQA